MVEPSAWPTNGGTVLAPAAPVLNGSPITDPDDLDRLMVGLLATQAGATPPEAAHHAVGRHYDILHCHDQVPVAASGGSHDLGESLRTVEWALTEALVVEVIIVDEVLSFGEPVSVERIDWA